MVLLEIQDTLRQPPSAVKTMKRVGAFNLCCFSYLVWHPQQGSGGQREDRARAWGVMTPGRSRLPRCKA